ncbi:helix-turn-helix transcriptional regulator [Streptomyces sp. NPDC021096]|uniref:helix-turn-helix domain-containing protein n=1 Tax=Streptomyces sp. NPDC021096 TaxID=3154792 RepID=UPI0033D1633F
MNFCQFCQTPLGSSGEPKVGRPQKYCSTPCRQAAYRMRKNPQAAVSAPGVPAPAAPPVRPPLPKRRPRAVQGQYQPSPCVPSGADEVLAEIIKDILEETRQLQRGLQALDAEEPLRRAEQLRAQLESLTAGLVGRARHRRVTWSRIGRLLNVSEDTARHRYTNAYILRRLSQHIHLRSTPSSLGALYGETAPAGESPPPSDLPVDTPLSARTPATPAFNRLAPVLSMLARASKMQLQVLSRRVGCSASYLSRILSGERVPAWPLTERFAIACGADPAVLRQVWETERLRDTVAVAAPVVASPGGVIAGQDRLLGPARLLAALRTLHVRAGQPTAYDIAVATRWRLSSDRVTTMLEGTQPAEWDDVAALLHVLGGPLDYFRPLWEAAVHQPDQQHRRPPGQEDEPEPSHHPVCRPAPGAGERTDEQAGAAEDGAGGECAEEADEEGDELHHLLTRFNGVLSSSDILGLGRREHLRGRIARRRSIICTAPVLKIDPDRP